MQQDARKSTAVEENISHTLRSCAYKNVANKLNTPLFGRAAGFCSTPWVDVRDNVTASTPRSSATHRYDGT